MKKLVLIVAILSINVFALNQVINVKKSNQKLPNVDVNIIGSDKATWSIYAHNRYRYVSVDKLKLTDAYELLSIAKDAKTSYEEIKNIGRCPNSIIKSGKLGLLKDASRDRISFEVICEKNNIVLKISMYDEYVVNYAYIDVEASDLEKFANSIIKELEKH
tara:strand:+ start:78 stop:560 length:483 start_codon:yes stop_codon:yes gene_type:complete